MRAAHIYHYYANQGGGYSNPEDTADNTNASSQQVWAIIGDSIANGHSVSVGPTPTAGTVYEFNGTDIVEVADADLLDANTGSPWPKFGIDYHATSGKKPVFVNTAVAGTFIRSATAGVSWWTNGTLYSDAKTKIDNALTEVGVTKVRGILIILGINDIGGATALSDINTGLTSLFTRLNTDYSNAPIYVCVPGRSAASYHGARHQYIRRIFTNAVGTYANVHAVGALLPYANWGLYNADGIHLTQAGNDQLGTLINGYITNTDENKYYKSVLTLFKDSISEAKKAAIKTFVDFFSDYFQQVDVFHMYVNTTADNMMVDWGFAGAPQNVNSVTFSANSHIATNGTNNYMRTHCLIDGTSRTTNTDYIEFAKTKSVITTAGTSAYLFGKGTTPNSRVYQTAGGLVFQVHDTTNTTYASETKFADDSIYAISRSTTTKTLRKGTTSLSSVTQATTGTITTQDTWVGASNQSGAIQAPIEAEYECYGLLKLSAIVWDDFVPVLNSLITAMKQA